jgi:acyl carrier protein
MAELPKQEIIEEKLCREFEDLMSLPPRTVSTQTNLPSLGVDSLRFVSLILAIEQKFGVNLMKVGIKPEDLITVKTLTAAIIAGHGK